MMRSPMADTDQEASPRPLTSQNIPSNGWLGFLFRNATICPEKVAVTEAHTGRQLNYQQLLQETTAWAAYLQSQGIGRGERVTFWAKNCIEHLTIFFACARLGAIFIPLNTRLAASEIESTIELAEPSMMLYRGQYPFLDTIPMTNCDDLDLAAASMPPPVDVSDRTPVLMLFTSGTTGAPKGVLFHGTMLKANQEETIKGWGLCSSDLTLVETPFFHTGGYNVLCLPLLSLGGTVCIADGFNPERTLERINQGLVTVYFAVPTMFQILWDHAKLDHCDFSNVRFFVSGGAPCPKGLIQNFLSKGVTFKQGFGMTEIGPNCFLLKADDALRKIGSIGQPMPHSEVLIIDEDGQQLPVGAVGELLIRGPHLCQGYFRDEKRYRESLLNGFLRTGDLAYRDSENFFYIAGRKKDMYVSGGENVYPAEVERALVTHPDIDDAVVVAVPSAKWGEVGLAFLRSTKELNLEEVTAFLRPILSRYKHPQHIAFKDSFPLLASGKIDRQALKREGAQRQLG